MNWSIDGLVTENEALLSQTQQLIERVGPEGYRCRHPALGAGSIGEHVRHMIEHYEELLGPGPRVDYDERRRDPQPESSPAAGRERLRTLQQQLRALMDEAGADGNADRPVTVNYHPDTAQSGAGMPLASSLGRELAFVSSHTLHHMALIRMLALQLGVEPAADFGVARATREFRQRSRPAPEPVTGRQRDPAPPPLAAAVAGSSP